MNKKTYRGLFSSFQNPDKYVGDITNCVFRSSWERNAFRWCDLNENIVNWASEELSILYTNPIKGKRAKYYPDLYIKFKDGSERVVEIKPKDQTIKPTIKRTSPRSIQEAYTYAVNQAKWAAADNFCKKNNIIFEVWTEDDLDRFGISRIVDRRALLTERKAYKMSRAKPRHKIKGRPTKRS